MCGVSDRFDRNTGIGGSRVHFLFLLMMCEAQAMRRVVPPMGGGGRGAFSVPHASWPAAKPVQWSPMDHKHVDPVPPDPAKRGAGRPKGSPNKHPAIGSSPADQKAIVAGKRKRQCISRLDAATGRAAPHGRGDDTGSDDDDSVGPSQARPAGGGSDRDDDAGDMVGDAKDDGGEGGDSKLEKKASDDDDGGGGGGARGPQALQAGAARRVRPSRSAAGRPAAHGAVPGDDTESDDEPDEDIPDELIEDDEVDENEMKRNASTHQVRVRARASDPSSSSDDQDDDEEVVQSDEEEEKKAPKSGAAVAGGGRKRKEKPLVVMKHAHQPTAATGKQRRENKCNKCKDGARVAYVCNLVGKTSQCNYSECAVCYAREQPRRDADDAAKGRLPWSSDLTRVAAPAPSYPPRGLRDIADTATILDIFYLFVPITLLEGIVAATNQRAEDRGKVVLTPSARPAHPVTLTHTHHHPPTNINFHIHSTIHTHHHSILTYIHTHHRNRICTQ